MRTRRGRDLPERYGNRNRWDFDGKGSTVAAGNYGAVALLTATANGLPASGGGAP
ncbi:hypothetical protein GCM10023081_41940 [Arthrobacter ginkgonis]|uniref:Uncharacterized protein n=1 Tax=Arthrobacter ginkgonis TaxID=1630594 RepID=A0ABP7D5C6_9MICC